MKYSSGFLNGPITNSICINGRNLARESRKFAFGAQMESFVSLFPGPSAIKQCWNFSNFFHISQSFIANLHVCQAVCVRFILLLRFEESIDHRGNFPVSN